MCLCPLSGLEFSLDILFGVSVMTNEYIEMVKAWQAGEAISSEELRANAADAADYWVKRYEELTDG